MSEPNGSSQELLIEGRPERLSSEYLLRFVERLNGPAIPVLYYHGRRVIAGWSLRMSHTQAADRWGISGGKD